MPSMAAAASLPMPAAAPTMVRPAPRPAERWASAKGFMCVVPPGTCERLPLSMRRVSVLTDEDGGEQGEDVGLDEGDQDLEQHEEEGERDRDRGHHHTACPVDLGDQRDQQDQGGDNDVTRQHVREETDHESEGLG